MAFSKQYNNDKDEPFNHTSPERYLTTKPHKSKRCKKAASRETCPLMCRISRKLESITLQAGPSANPHSNIPKMSQPFSI